MSRKIPRSSVIARVRLIVVFFLALLFIAAIYNRGNNVAVVDSIKNSLTTQLRLLSGQTLCPDCNVILVSLDTLSANHLPCYGYARDTSPRLCEFAKENIIFKNMYANAHFTLPSHTTMFTGLLPSRHGVITSGKDSLSPAIPFLPEVLQQNGYLTYFNIPVDGKGGDLPIDKVYYRGINVINPESWSSLSSWNTLLNTFQKNKSEGKKSFLFLHTYYVHSPYTIQGNPLYTDKHFSNIPADIGSFKTCNSNFIATAKKVIKARLDKGEWNNLTTEYERIYREFMNNSSGTEVCESPVNRPYLDSIRFNYFFSKDNINTPEMVAYLRDLYDQRINELDAELFDTLFSFFNQPDIKANTILIITADHGEEFMEHNEIQHITIYDSNVKIPLIIYVPNVGHKEISANVQTADLMPTILDMVGIKNNYRFQGASTVPVIAGGHMPDRVIVAERESDKTVRDQEYKLFLKNANQRLIPYELYDIQKDPGEANNIIFKQPDIVKRMEKQLQSILTGK